MYQGGCSPASGQAVLVSPVDLSHLSHLDSFMMGNYNGAVWEPKTLKKNHPGTANQGHCSTGAH